MPPVIGMTTFNKEQPSGSYVSIDENYIWSVRAAGGLPVPIPTPRPEDGDEPGPWLDLVDGLLFTGGGDIAPTTFGEDPLRQVESVVTARDEWELSLFAAARERGLPILGICRGHQLLNVALGGTLYQDIPAQLPGATGHSPSGLPAHEPYHRIVVEPSCRLRTALALVETGETLLVNSFHHQAVRDLAPGLRVTARSLDGIVEGFEGDGIATPFLMAVQFHPEGMTRRHPRFLGIFCALVEAAAGT